MLMMLALGARPLEGESQLMLMMLALGLSLYGGSQLMFFGARLLKEGLALGPDS